MRDGVTLYVDGSWAPARSGTTAEAVNPATGTAIGRISAGTREDAARAVEAAARSVAPGTGPTWATWSPFDRAAAMDRVVDVLEARRDELARALTDDQGKPLRTESYDEVDELIVYFRMAAADATRLPGFLPPSIDANKRVLVQRVPRGVIGVVTPWNWPYTMAAEVIAPALAAGNSVVWNPAMHTSLCSTRLAECIVEADLPAGVFNLVTGRGSEVGDEIAGHSLTAAIGFVGSTATGLRIAARAAGKELLLEMGGNGPLVVLADADLAKAVDATLTACYLNAGQSCTAGERILVAEQVHEEYVARLHAALADRIRLGDPLADATSMGPLNNEAAVEKTERHVADALERGATLVTGGGRDESHGSSLFYAPTILDDVTEVMAVAREETFGPVAPITPIRDVDEAIAIVNASPYGLLSAVFTADLGQGLRFAESVRSGWVNINEGTNYWESHLPFGGRAGSQSGVGRVGGAFAMERLTELKTIVIDLGSSRPELPVHRGSRPQPGIDLDDTATLLDQMHDTEP